MKRFLITTAMLALSVTSAFAGSLDFQNKKTLNDLLPAVNDQAKKTLTPANAAIEPNTNQKNLIDGWFAVMAAQKLCGFTPNVEKIDSDLQSVGLNFKDFTDKEGRFAAYGVSAYLKEQKGLADARTMMEREMNLKPNEIIETSCAAFATGFGRDHTDVPGGHSAKHPDWLKF